MSLANPFCSAIIGKSVSDIWADGSALFLEVGNKIAATGRLASILGSSYELSLAIRSSWRIEQTKSILGGSWSDQKERSVLLKKLVGASVTDIQFIGELPEIYVVFSNGLRFSSFTASRGQPEWALITRNPNLGTLCVRRGSLFVEPPDL